MDIGADYIITEAGYGPGRQLSHALRHKVTGQGVEDGQIIDKLTLVSEIKDNARYVTAHKDRRRMETRQPGAGHSC